MTSSLISPTTNAFSTISESITDISNNEKDEEGEENHWHELTLVEHNSLLTSLKRIYIYWRKILLKKIRLVFTVVFVTLVDIARRLRYFTRETTTDQSLSPLSPIIDSPSNSSVEHNSTLIHFSLPNDLSSMTHILVQQQTPNINRHPCPSTMEEKDLSPTSSSLDNRIFFTQSDSQRFMQILEQLTSEKHLPKYQQTSTKDFLKKTLPLPYTKPQETSHCDIISEENKNGELDSNTLAVEVDEDALSEINANVNVDRPTRRRKRRSSLTKTFSNDQSEPLLKDSIETIETTNANTSSQVNAEIESIPIETLSIQDSKQQDSNETTTHANPIRGRRLRYRSYRQTIPTLPEISPSIPLPPSPTQTESSSLSGVLKRNGSFGSTTKKAVRFADSVGRELAQVQYIQAPFEDGDDDDDDDDHLLFGKNDLYLPKTSPLEHKPWSFDLALRSKTFSDTPTRRRFFCLYRQPNSEHPDIYLHEIWKNQIKLEHADVRLKSSETGEQYISGTVWVTNAGFWKNVTVKYTFNHWVNSYEYECQHRCHSNDFRNIDQFQFTIDIPHDVDRIDFVLRYRVNGQEFWDNNNGQNYTIETDSASIPSMQISLPHDCDFNEMRFY